MALSPAALQGALASWTAEAYLECLTFDHPTLMDPVRLVNDRVDLTRTAGVFTAFPFIVKLHSRDSDRIAEATITADNVSQLITKQLRGLEGMPTVDYEVVLADTPNTVEVGPMPFEVMGFNVNVQQLSLRVGFNFTFLNEAFPKDWFAPWNSQEQ